jgi:hypothetical protein
MQQKNVNINKGCRLTENVLGSYIPWTQYSLLNSVSWLGCYMYIISLLFIFFVNFICIL